MSISRVGVNAIAFNNVSSGNLALPSALQSGDMAELFICWNNTGGITVTTPTGFTIVPSSTVTVGNTSGSLYTKPVNGADSGTNIALAASAANNWNASVAVHRGVDNANPIGSVVTTSESVNGTTDHAHPLAALTTTVGTQWDCAFAGERGSSPSSSIGFGSAHTLVVGSAAYNVVTGGTSVAFGDSNGPTTVATHAADSFNDLVNATATTLNCVSIRYSLNASATALTATAQTPGQIGLLLVGGFNYATDTIKACLLGTGFTFDKDNLRFMDHASITANEIAAGNGYTAGGVTLTSKTTPYISATDNVALKAATLSWTATVGTQFASAVQHIVIYKSTGTAGTSAVIGVISLAAPVTVDGLFTVDGDSTYGLVTINTV